MVFSVVAASVFGTGGLIFNLSLAAARVAAVSRHIFTMCPYQRHVLQLIGISEFSWIIFFSCSPGISMNLGGSFSLRVSRNGVEWCFWFLSKLFFPRPRGRTLSLVHCHSHQCPGFYSRGCRSGIFFGWFCCERMFQLIPFIGIVENNCDFIVGIFLLSLSFEISMKNSDSLFDFMVAGFFKFLGWSSFILPTVWILFSFLCPFCIWYVNGITEVSNL